jgi:hypothetical protein
LTYEKERTIFRQKRQQIKLNRVIRTAAGVQSKNNVHNVPILAFLDY